MTQARKIIDIKVTGKWVEVWFDDGNRDPGKYDQCCKAYMLAEAADKSEYYQDGADFRYPTYFVGWWCIWPEGADRPALLAKSLSGLSRPQPE